MKSISLFGDSILKGVVLDQIRGRYTLLKNSFVNLLSRNSEFTLNSYAKFGCTVSVGEGIVEKHIDKLSVSRYTVLEFGGNDCDFNWAAVSQSPEKQHFPNTPLPDFEALYSRIIDRIAASGSQPVLLSLPPLDAKRYFAWITKGLNADNILRWLGDVERIYRWHEMYNLAVVQLASKKQVPLIDIRRAFLEARNCSGLICEDGIHPNEAGHLMIANAIKSFVAERNPSFAAFSV